MSTTLQTLRRDTGFDLGACTVGTVDSSTGTSITDAELLDADESETKYARNWVKTWVETSIGVYTGMTRRIRETEGYTPSTGTIAWGRALVVGRPDIGEDYEIHTLMHPDDLDTLINRGLKRCHYVDEEWIDVVSGQREYDLSSYTWLTRKKQVTKVLWVQGTTSLKQRHLPMWWRVEEEAGAFTLHVKPYTASTGQQMVLIGTRPYATLSSDTDTTDCPEDWARAAAILEVYGWLLRNGPAQDVERYRTARDEAALVWYEKCRRFAPRPSFVVRLPDTGSRVPPSNVVM